ncbi:MAG: alpha/beta hydrolase [Pseudomonadota bacterium]|nr:alpha/beta hydrolase [Pseudomonadota bacterium]
MPTSLKTRHIAGHRVRLVASEGGDTARPSVVLLHGGGQTRHAWNRLAKTLVSAGYHVLSLDLRGHGDSDWAPDGDYSSDAFMADIRAVLAELPDRPVLVGASLGGLMSLLTVGESEEPTARALVLVDVTPRIDMAGRARIIGFMRDNIKGFASLDEAADAVSAYLPHRPRPKNPAGLMRNLRLKDDGRYYWHWDPGFFEGANATHTDPESRYTAAARRVRIPTLLVRGEHSELVKEEGVRHFLEVIPGAEYVDVGGARHMVVGDNNDAFADAVLTFLGRLEPGVERST